MTLYHILGKIFTYKLFSLLSNTYFEDRFTTARQIFENEIWIWLSSLESIYPSILQKLSFIKPDYNEALFYEIKYRYESDNVKFEHLWEQLEPSFQLELQFLEGIVNVLTTLLNHKGSLESIGLKEGELFHKRGNSSIFFNFAWQ